MDANVAFSSENGPAPVEEDEKSVSTSSMNTIIDSQSTGVITLDHEQDRTPGGEAEGTRRTGESSSMGEDSTEIISRGIASVLGPVVKNFETRVEEVVKSQHTLENSIDRLTKELDKLLEDTPLPLGAQHAAKLSGIRKRVGSLSDTLRIVQGRINSMETMLSDSSVNLLPK